MMRGARKIIREYIPEQPVERRKISRSGRNDTRYCVEGIKEVPDEACGVNCG